MPLFRLKEMGAPEPFREVELGCSLTYGDVITEDGQRWEVEEVTIVLEEVELFGWREIERLVEVRKRHQ